MALCFDGWPCVLAVDHLSPGSSPHSLVSRFGGLSEPTLKRYVHQVLEALWFLHRHGIVHGDLSIDHMLLTSTGTVAGCIKLCGLASQRRATQGPRSTRSVCMRVAACLQGQGAMCSVWSVPGRRTECTISASPPVTFTIHTDVACGVHRLRSTPPHPVVPGSSPPQL